MDSKEILASKPEGTTHVLIDIETISKQQEQFNRLHEQVSELAEKAADTREKLSAYNFESVDELIAKYESQVRKIIKLEKEHDTAMSIVFSVACADLCFGSFSTYEIGSDTVEAAKQLREGVNLIALEVS